MAIAAASSSSLSSAAAAALLLLAMAMAMATEGATAVSVDCNNVNRYFVPCLGFLVSSASSPSPSPQCCANVRSLNAQSKGPVRAAVCQCIKRNAQNIPGLNQQRASSLPTLCRIPLGLKITPTTDCSRA